MEQHEGHGRKLPIGSAVLAFILVFALSFTVLFLVEKEVRGTQIRELKLHEKRVVKLVGEFFSREFNRLLSDLHYLQRAYEDDLIQASNYDEIRENWVAFSNSKLFYDQIRYIDAAGDEVIRVNLGTDSAYAVPGSELQNKKDRYYFIETVKLPEGGIYISPLDLNVENQEVEVPYKPMLRLSSPVYDKNGTLRGILMLSCLADDSLTRFRELSSNSQGEVILLNADGYRLSSADPARGWNFMFAGRKGETFGKEYPKEWAAILGGRNG